MNRNKTFCEECRRDVEYIVETATIKGKLKGEEYEYTGKKAVCTECGSEVYVADIEDENLKALYDTYKKSVASDTGATVVRTLKWKVSQHSLDGIYEVSGRR